MSKQMRWSGAAAWVLSERPDVKAMMKALHSVCFYIVERVRAADVNTA